MFTQSFGTPTQSLEDAYYNPFSGTDTSASVFSLYGTYGHTWAQVGTATSPTGSAVSLSAAPSNTGNEDVSNVANAVEYHINC